MRCSSEARRQMGPELMIVPASADDLEPATELRQGLGDRAAVCLLAADGLAAASSPRVVIGVAQELADGQKFLQRLGAPVPECQVMVLSQDDAPETGVALMQLGADVWLPISTPLPLIASYAGAQLRRATERLDASVGEPVLDRGSSTLRWGNHEASLSSAEFRVLDYFLTNPGRWIPAQEIRCEALHIRHQSSDSLVRVYVRGLRRLLGPHAARLESKWGEGYRFTMQ